MQLLEGSLFAKGLPVISVKKMAMAFCDASGVSETTFVLHPDLQEDGVQKDNRVITVMSIIVDNWIILTQFRWG